MEISSIIRSGAHEKYDFFGPTLEFLTSPSDEDAAYCIMKGTIPPGTAIPIHSHPDDESFYILSGTARVLTETNNKLRWEEVRAGDLVHVHQSTKHAWKNDSVDPIVVVATTTPTLGKFFQEVGRPIIPGIRLLPPTPDELQNFVRVSMKYGHWMGSPQENADLGISMFGV